MADELELIGVILTVVFGLTTVFFYFKSRRFKQPKFVLRRSTLQTRNHPRVSILFDNREVKNLSRAQILFYNAGSMEIRQEDVPSNGRLSIEFKEGVQVLSYNVLARSSEEINFSIYQDGKRYLAFEFDYLNPGDGALMEVLFEDTEERKEIPVVCNASIIGARKAVVVDFAEESTRFDRIVPLVRFDLIVSSIGSLGILGMGIYIGFVSVLPSFYQGVLGGVLIALGSTMFWTNVIRQLKKYVRLPHFVSDLYR